MTFKNPPVLLRWRVFSVKEEIMNSITIKINGQFASKSSKNIGAAGSSAEIKFIFDESWKNYAKRVLWRDCKGENLTSIILVPDIENPDTYISGVPSSVMKEAGWCSFTVEGYHTLNPSIVNKSVTDTLFVSYSEGGEIVVPTPSEAIQLQKEFESLMPKVSALMQDTRKEIDVLCENFKIWEEYDDEKFYKEGNKVVFDGSTYLCTGECMGVSPENEDFWILVASRGKRGQKGAQGPQGVIGQRGEKGEKGERGEKGECGEKGERGERGMGGICASANGFYTLSVDENGDLWINYPDSTNKPSANINSDGELILTLDGANYSFNVGDVRGPAFTYKDFTEEQKDELLSRAIPEIAEVNEAARDAINSAENAKKSEENSSQALSDLLNMINSGDIVLAVNGKLPLSSIPATATQEIYVVESEDDLTTLEAQRGDLAELVETINGERTITKTWQCLGDASKRENWVVWGTSYAVSAGNSEQSKSAENSMRINGHRLVEMSEAEFENAVKDEDTYYLVY